MIQDKIDIILAFAEEHSNFDTSFIESLQEQFDRKGFLSSSQEMALDNIIDKFRMEEYEN